MPSTSPNFAFLEQRDPQLHGYASRAERYFSDDPNGSLVKMRQFAETLAHATAANFGAPASTETAFIDLLRGGSICLAIFPDFPWSLPVDPTLLQRFQIARGVHALPVAFVPESHQLSMERHLFQRLLFENA